MQRRKPPLPALTVKLSKYNVDDIALGVCKTGAEEAGVTEVRTSLSEKKFELLREMEVLGVSPLKDYVTAVSVGIVGGEILLDLDYAEDSHADVDLNIAMRGSGELVEVQATAEGQPYTVEDLNRLIEVARPGIQKLLAVQRSVLKLDFSGH